MANPGPVAAIRQFCLECQGNSSRSVRQCADEDCPLWGWRMAAIEADSRPEWHGPDAPRRALRVILGHCMMCAVSRTPTKRGGGAFFPPSPVNCFDLTERHHRGAAPGLFPALPVLLASLAEDASSRGRTP